MNRKIFNITVLKSYKGIEGDGEMANQKLIDEVGRYIDKYYEPVKDDIKVDKEMLSIFDKITKLRKKRAKERRIQKEKNRNTVRLRNPYRKNLIFLL